MPKPAEAAMKWLEISDFSPGIITNSDLSYGNPLNSPHANSGPVPGSKLGQAQMATGCISLPNGGLAPLPGLFQPSWSSTYQIPPPEYDSGAPVNGSTVNLVNGFFVNGPINRLYRAAGGTIELVQPGDELVIGQIQARYFNDRVFPFVPDAARIWWYLTSLKVFPAVGDGVGPAAGTQTSNIIENFTATTSSDGILPLTTMTGGLTRANATPADPGNACWALEYWYTSNPPTNVNWDGQPFQWLYPDPTAGGMTFVPFLLGDANPGQVLCHQNRVVQLTLTSQPYGSNQLFQGNETFNYTEPPNSTTLGTQSEVFVQEDPSGYGAWNSIAASELFLVKNRGGGVVIQGDLNAPTVTRLPGVTPTEGLMSRSAATPIGAVYAVNNRGLWTWNGGSSSQKISSQLDDDFMINPLAKAQVYQGPTVDICSWGEWVIVSNDWLYDTTQGGWWKLQPTTDNLEHTWYGTSWDGNTLYACLLEPTASHMMDVYGRATPANNFVWQSFPMRPADVTKNHSLDIREVVIRAQGFGTVEISLTGLEASTATASPSNTVNVYAATDNSQPVIQRITTGLIAQDVTITINSLGITETDAAPVVYSVAIGYVETPAKVNAG